MRTSRFTQFVCSTLIAAILLAAMPVGIALAGSCDDGTAGPDTITCIADPIAPDDGNIGLGLGDDTYTQNDLVFTDEVIGDGLEDGSQNTGDGGDDEITIEGGAFVVIGDGTDGDGGADIITIDGETLAVLGDLVTGGGGADTIIINGDVFVQVSGDASDGDGGNDVITVDGYAALVSGDDAILNGGNDTITINGEADDVMGDDVDGNGGDDIIVINGLVNFDVTGDCAPTGDGGDDQITINGVVVGDVIGDCAGGNGGNDTIIVDGEADIVSGDDVAGNGGDDTIIINGEVDSVEGDFVDGNGGDDLIIINGTVNNDVTGDCADGDGGDDTIIVNGDVGGDIDGDCVVGAGGDDSVTVGLGATIGGLIDGNDGTDTLIIEGATQSQLDGLNPAGGSVTIGGITYTWTDFESLIGLLAEIAERLGLRILYRANDLLATADAEGISVYAEHGRIAFISFATAAELGLGESQIFQTGNAAGWYVSVSNVGAGPNGNSEFQVSIFNPSGTIVGQFSFFN